MTPRGREGDGERWQVHGKGLSEGNRGRNDGWDDDTISNRMENGKALVEIYLSWFFTTVKRVSPRVSSLCSRSDFVRATARELEGS